MNHPSEEAIQAYMDRTLEGEEAKLLRDHLRFCADCRGIVREYQRLCERLQTEPSWQFSSQFDARVMRKITREPLGDVFNKLWTALVISGILIGALSVTAVYTDVKAYWSAIRNISLPNFKMNLDFFKMFHFISETTQYLEGRINLAFLLTCIGALLLVAACDHVIQLAKRSTPHREQR